MDYNVKIKIGDTELLEFAGDEQIPYVTNVKRIEAVSLDKIEIGATASDSLQFTMVNPYATSFDGQKVELWLSPQSDTTETGLGEIEDEVGTDEDFEAVDENELEALEDESEDGEDLTPTEEAEAEAEEEENIEAEFTFFDGEADTITDITTSEEEEPEWTLFGTYYVFAQNNSSEDNSIRFECFDGFCLMGGAFTPTNRQTTIQNIYNDLKAQCLSNLGVIVDDFEFDTVYNISVNWDFETTYRKALGILAGVVGGYAEFAPDNTVGISFFAPCDTILLDRDVIEYNETSAGYTSIDGIICDRSTNPYKDDIIEVGSGQSIAFSNPFVTPEILEEIYATYKGIGYVGADVSMIWHDVLQAGHFVRIMTDEEFANYVALNNAYNETSDPAELLDLKASINGLGKTILINNQVIDFTGDATTKIKGAGISESAKANTAPSPSDGVFKNLYAEMIKADYIDAVKVVTEGLEAEDATVKSLVADSLDVGSINGNVIQNGTILAAALSSSAIQTIGGNKVYYQAEAPTGGTYVDGDTWYQTVQDGSSVYASNLYEYRNGSWVAIPLDANVLRANSITAQEIASNTITTTQINMDNLQTNLAYIGDKTSRHIRVNSDGIHMFISGDVEGTNEIAHFGYGETQGEEETINAPYYNLGSRNTIYGIGEDSVVEGSYNSASGFASHAEGASTYAFGIGSHSEGRYTEAGGDHSHAEGYYTFTGSDNQHAQGKFNVIDRGEKYADIVGNGTSQTDVSNAFALEWNGNGHYAGDVYVGCNADSSGGTKLAKITDIQHIGQITETSNEGNIALTANTAKSIASITLPKGKYTIQGNARFNSISSAGTRLLSISTNTSMNYQGYNEVYVPSNTNGYVNVTRIMEITEDNTTVNLLGYCGSAINCSYRYLKAIRQG